MFAQDPREELLKACASVGFEQLTLRLGISHEQLNAWLAGSEPIPREKIDALTSILIQKPS